MCDEYYREQRALGAARTNVAYRTVPTDPLDPAYRGPADGFDANGEHTPQDGGKGGGRKRPRCDKCGIPGHPKGVCPNIAATKRGETEAADAHWSKTKTSCQISPDSRVEATDHFARHHVGACKDLAGVAPEKRERMA